MANPIRKTISRSLVGCAVVAFTLPLSAQASGRIEFTSPVSLTERDARRIEAPLAVTPSPVRGLSSAAVRAFTAAQLDEQGDVALQAELADGRGAILFSKAGAAPQLIEEIAENGSNYSLSALLDDDTVVWIANEIARSGRPGESARPISIGNERATVAAGSRDRIVVLTRDAVWTGPATSPRATVRQGDELTSIAGTVRVAKVLDLNYQRGGLGVALVELDDASRGKAVLSLGQDGVTVVARPADDLAEIERPVATDRDGGAVVMGRDREGREGFWMAKREQLTRFRAGIPREARFAMLDDGRVLAADTRTVAFGRPAAMEGRSLPDGITTVVCGTGGVVAVRRSGGALSILAGAPDSMQLIARTGDEVPMDGGSRRVGDGEARILAASATHAVVDLPLDGDASDTTRPTRGVFRLPIRPAGR